MADVDPLWTLGFFTIIAALLIAGMLGSRFLKARNRHPMEGQRERNIEEIRNEADVEDKLAPRP